MDKVYINGLMVKCLYKFKIDMKVNGKKVNNMEKEKWL